MFKLAKDAKLRKGKKGYIVKFDEYFGCFAPEIIQCEVGNHDGLINRCAERFSSNYDIQGQDIFLSMRDFKKMIAPLVKERQKIIKQKELAKQKKMGKLKP